MDGAILGEPLGGSQFGAARARIISNLFRSRLHYMAGEVPHHSVTIPLLKGLLCDAIFQGMKADDD